MQKFLQLVAADLWQRYGESVGELKVILPNERTRVFLNDALSQVAGRAIWSPEFLSIDSLMVSLSGLERMDSIGAITLLYKVYSEIYSAGGREAESFDSFYRWGEVLLNDFDAVDKYLIDADMLFANVADLKDVDADLADYLGEEGLAIVKRFWREFDAERRSSKHKAEFLNIWRTLLPTYKAFRQRLAEQNVGYTGMIYRSAADAIRLSGAELPAGRYVAVGFNALSEAEKILFDHLRKVHNADFYWDYDDYYLLDEKQEAGLFVRENLRRYPMPEGFVLPSCFGEPKEIKVVSTASDSLQCKYVGEFVDEIVKAEKKIDKNTAIVLTNEGLLSPLLYSLPGFNALSEAEKILFDHLRKVHNADFYWDYDDYYLLDEKQEAGLFVRENLRRYPMPEGFVLPSCFGEPKEIKVVSTASDSLQCKYVGEFVDEIVKAEKKIDKNTAIVLTNEGLLSPLLYSLPDSVGKVNITMGYPLRNTLAYSFVERLLQLQLRVRRTRQGKVSFYHSDVVGLLSHPFVVAIDRRATAALKSEVVRRGRIHIEVESLAGCHPVLDKLFSHHDNWAGLKDYLLEIVALIARAGLPNESKERRALMRECFGLMAETIIKVDNSVARCGVEMKLSTYAALLRRVMQGLRIPYSGEPLRGVQVMGILETRNLDFDNVIVLSMNDDNFPSGRISDTSFIPYNLRFAYGMPTPRHNEGVYAYYFYRLIQRARRVDLVYRSVPNDKSSAEHSRYIYQLDFESPHKLKRIEKSLNVNLAEKGSLRVEKKGDVLKRLQAYLGRDGEQPLRKISPSTFNNYMECSLKFYFSAIAGIRTPEEIEEGVDYALFGTIFHKAMELLYKPMMTKHLPPIPYLSKLTEEDVHNAVVEAITEEFFGGDKVEESEYGGHLIVVRDTVETYINTCVLPYDRSPERTDYRVRYLEHPMESDFEFSRGKVTFHGISDRIDMMPDGSLRIIDYKTGSIHKDFSGISGLMKELPKEHNGAVLQTLIYSMVAERMQQRGEIDGKGATPSLYYVRYMRQADYSPLLTDKSNSIPVSSYSEYREEFERELDKYLNELFDENEPFVATDNEKSCEWCDFARICRRG